MSASSHGFSAVWNERPAMRTSVSGNKVLSTSPPTQNKKQNKTKQKQKQKKERKKTNSGKQKKKSFQSVNGLWGRQEGNAQYCTEGNPLPLK